MKKGMSVKVYRQTRRVRCAANALPFRASSRTPPKKVIVSSASEFQRLQCYQGQFHQSSHDDMARLEGEIKEGQRTQTTTAGRREVRQGYALKGGLGVRIASSRRAGYRPRRSTGNATSCVRRRAMVKCSSSVDKIRRHRRPSPQGAKVAKLRGPQSWTACGQGHQRPAGPNAVVAGLIELAQ